MTTNRFVWCVTIVLFFPLFQHTVPFKFICNGVTCVLENIDLDEEYTFAFAYPNNSTDQLTVSYIKGTIFDLTTLPNLSNLRHFLLQHSQLDSLMLKLTANRSSVDIVDTPLKTLLLHESQNVVEVRLERTQLTAIPESIFTQESLETLFITHSLLTAIELDLFEQLPNLRYVSFYYNRIKVLHLTPGIVCCERTVSMDLQNNRLEKFDFGVLSYMSCLEIVTLRANRIHTIEHNVPSEIPPPGMPQSCCSELYSECDEKSVDLTIQSRVRYASLTTIDLASNRLRLVDLSLFKDMPKLMELMLSKNLITNVIVSGSQLPKRLECIDLGFNRLANADFRPILSIKSVNVGGNL